MVVCRSIFYYCSVIMTKNIILSLALGLVCLSVPAQAQTYESYSERMERERKESSATTSAPCYSSDCRDKEDADSDRDSDNDHMRNSFQNQRSQKGSIGSMVTNQLQPR